MNPASHTLLSLAGSEFKKLKFIAKNEYFILHHSPAQVIDKNQKKLGFRLSKKHLKNATSRNYCKRITREFLRKNKVSCISLVLSSRLRLPNKNVKEICKDKLHNLLAMLLVK